MNVQATCILIRKVTEKVWFELNGCNLFFKVKGGPIAPIVAERFDSIRDFVEYACTDNRMN